jgi:tRNA-specific 2-thiouridylase
MSGGIDSSVSAMMLHEQGFEVIGITMKTWDYATSGGAGKETGCCSLDSINDARQVAVKMGFHHFVIDIRDEFGNYVIDNFVDEYMAGRTPNPCVLCNTHIKWHALLKRANALECKYIATGHYAVRAEKENRYFIKRAKDLNKDQSYVLWGLDQECLSRSIFPLGNYLKPDVRAIAHKSGFSDLANKPESYEICFVPDNDYRGFLKRQVANLEKDLDGGPFINKKGEILGYHKGYPFYTIGQRKGLGIALGEPMYVSEIQPEKNTVVLGTAQELVMNGMVVSQVNSMKYPSIPDDHEVVTKIRYRDPGTLSSLHQEGNNVYVSFHANVKGVAPGQSAVFYENDDLIGGGIIHQGKN